MVTNPYFAIGDLQGCLESLDGLLEQLPEDARSSSSAISSTGGPNR